MNIGLLMPGEIINEAIEYAETKSIPLNSLDIPGYQKRTHVPNWYYPYLVLRKYFGSY